MPKGQSFTGKVLFQYFYDIGGDIDLENLPSEKLNVVERTRPKTTRILAPKYEEIGLKPVEVNLGQVEMSGLKFAVSGKIFPIGVIEICLSTDFKGIGIEDLIKLVCVNEEKIRSGSSEKDFDEVPLEFFREIKSTIKRAIVYPYPQFENPEVYTVVVLSETEPQMRAKDFMKRYRKMTAGILRGEKEWLSLSDREVDDALKFYLSYSDKEIVIVDWYSALVSGGSEYVDELVGMMELAKIQLLELKTYDRLLDRRIEKAYESLRSVFTGSRIGIAWLSRTYGELSKTASELAELRIEVMDYVGDLRNILKFTGEWYLGKLYRAASERFRVGDWLVLVDKKLDQLQDLYAIAMERVDVHRATSLEFLVILLIISLVILEILMVLQKI
ncbi:MAG: hypothetical protein QXG10_03985 [Candidatus Hadarchaeales archaeon]